MTDTDAGMNGVLAVDKPAGPTSHDVVAHARRALRTRRIGHTGTLDPFATGLLLLCIGSATRIAAHLTGSDKRYLATLRLGSTTDTDDLTGTIVAERDASGVTRDDLERALAAQRGTIAQVPPQYSAKKKEGRRAYALAREGTLVELDAVNVTIRELVLTGWDPPFAEIDVLCSAGTYIRSIARDVGESLGTGAHLTALRRTAIGAIDVADALPLHALADADRVEHALMSALDALGDMTSVNLSDDDVVHIRHGRSIPARAGIAGDVALAAHGELVALATADEERIRPRKVFA
jgi:tRNA pseudouridine55 synthase